jgi:hypothetical protein
MGISPMPELFPKLFEGDMREAASFGLVNPSLVRMFRKPLARELFDYPRCFSAMKIEGALEIAMVSNRMKTRIDPDVLRQFTAEEIAQLATR